MPLRHCSANEQGIAEFKARWTGTQEDKAGRLEAVRDIVATVRQGGDDALADAVRRYDGSRIASLADTRWQSEDIEQAAGQCSPHLKRALQIAAARIAAAHRRQPADNLRVGLGAGTRLEWRHRPLARVGCYVPGGQAAYPSTLLMCAITARVAGVRDIVIATPAKPNAGEGALAFAMQLAGIGEVWQIGGAHAIAALTYGTQSIAPCQAIAGPGNNWVAGAKEIVSGDVAIDSIAGPSEVLVLAGTDSDPQILAADLLAQAEHDTSARAGLVALREDTITATIAALNQQLKDLPRADIAAQALQISGSAICARSIDQALAFANEIAPEHLQLHGEEFVARADDIHNAGAVFLGPGGCEVMGDYLAGSNHVLPTGGRATFQSALGTETFRRSHWQVAIDCPHELAETAATLADAEGLGGHARAARMRGKSP